MTAMIGLYGMLMINETVDMSPDEMDGQPDMSMGKPKKEHLCGAHEWPNRWSVPCSSGLFRVPIDF